MYGHVLPSGKLSSVERGREIAQMSIWHHGNSGPAAFRRISSEDHEEFAKNQQVIILHYISLFNCNR